MRVAAILSTLLHLAVFLFAWFGLPARSPDVVELPRVIDVEVVAAESVSPEPVPEPKKAPKPQAAPQPAPKPDPPKPEPQKPKPPKPEPPKQIGREPSRERVCQ